MKSDNQVTRRGFLSFVVGLSAITAIPAIAEPPKLVKSIVALRGSHKTLRVVRYCLALTPDSNDLIEPGKVTILRARPQIVLRPERLIFNETGFNLLHLGMNGNPLFDNEVPSDLFAPTSFGCRLDFATVDPQEEIIVAAVNRNHDPRKLVGAIMSTAIEESDEPLPVYMPGRDFDDDDDDDDDDDEV